MKQHKPWFDEDCLGFLDQGKQAQMQWLQDTSQSNVDNLNNVRCEASRHFMNKNEYLKTKIEEPETNHNHWHNSPISAQAFFRSFCQLSLFLAAFLQFFSPNFLASSLRHPPILVSAYPFAFFLLLLQPELFLQGSVPPVK
jgi:hypothetical protein